MQVIVTAPMVPFKVSPSSLRHLFLQLAEQGLYPLQVVHPDGQTEIIETPGDFPYRPKSSSSGVAKVYEPMVRTSIITPAEYLGDLLPLMKVRGSVGALILGLTVRGVTSLTGGALVPAVPLAVVPCIYVVCFPILIHLTGLLSLELQERRGTQEDIKYIDDMTVILVYRMPWQEVVTDFFDQLKTLTAGYGAD